jgi:hypothetical protein
MNYKTVSSRNIIEAVFSRYRNYISQDSDALLGNGIEWIGEALEAIGILPAMENITESFIISNGKVHLPCNLFQLKSVAHRDNWVPYGSQTFNYDMHCDNCINEFAKHAMPYSYIVNPNWLQTNIPDGETICLSYRAFAVDEEGFPQIPDKVTVKQALFWYISMWLCLGGMENPSVNFNQCEERWLKYCIQAENDIAMLDAGQRATFKNQWVRMIPDISRERNFFADISEEQTIQHYKTFRL